MATTRKVIKIPVVTGGDRREGLVYSSFSYHPDYELNPERIRWTSGGVSREDYCLCPNASTYIGSGTPQNATASSYAVVSSLKGKDIGCVPYSYSPCISDLGHYVVEGQSYTEYEQTVQVSNGTYGSVSITTGFHKTKTGTSLSYTKFKKSSGPDSTRIPEGVTYLSPTYAVKDGGEFLGWYVNGVKSTSSDTYGDDTITAVIGAPFTVKFDPNLGTGTMDEASYYYGVGECIPQGNIEKCKFTRSMYEFAGWNTVKTTTSSNPGIAFEDGCDAESIFSRAGLSAGDTVTLYAQWRFVGFYIKVTRASATAGVSVPSDVGVLSLLDYTNNRTVATESNGALVYRGEIDGNRYKVVCTMPATKPSLLWAAKGVYEDGAYVADYIFKPTAGDTRTKSFYFEQKALYALSISVHVMDASGVEITESIPACTASVTSPTETDAEGKYVAGRAITITGVPTAGYRMTTANVGGNVYTIAEGNAFTIPSLDADAVAHCYFTKIPYTLNVTKDAASTAVITGVTVAGGSTKRDATYGDQVEFSATLTNAAGYQFDGWYDGATRVSTANPYTHTVTGDATLTAKAQAKVAFHVAPRDNRTTPSPEATPGTCSVTPSAETYVTLGESADYALTLGAIYEGSAANWIFNAWFNTADTGRTNPLQMSQDGTLAIAEPVDVTADVTSVVLSNVVTITVRNDENETVIANASAITAYPAPDSGGWDAANNRYALTFVGTKSVRLTAKDSIAVGPNTLAFSGYKVGTADIHANPQYTFLANGNLSITAYYGSTGNRKVTLAYAVKGGTRGDRTMGKFAISAKTDPNGTISADGHTATVARGSKLTIVAEPMNGYRFGGWYAQETVGGTAKFADAAFDLTVGTELALFAYFEQDPNAVYEWEGSANNKSFTWRSKTYVAGKPFNPACCRVDTEGYPLVSLQVDMFSAPDTAPTARVELDNVASQTARRLPVRRPERYLQVCVQNSYEVDAVIIGTNMTELAQ